MADANDTNAVVRRVWALTDPVLAALDAPEWNPDAYRTAVEGLAADVGTDSAVWCWAGLLWPTIPPVDAEHAAALYGQDYLHRAWPTRLYTLLETSARVALANEPGGLRTTAELADGIHAQCGDDEIWEMMWELAQDLHQVITLAGDRHRLWEVIHAHYDWVPPSHANLAGALALIVAALAAGSDAGTDAAREWMSHLVGRGVPLEVMLTTWIAAAGELLGQGDVTVIPLGPDGWPRTTDDPAPADQLALGELLGQLVTTAAATVQAGQATSTTYDMLRPHLDTLSTDDLITLTWESAGAVAVHLDRIHTTDTTGR